MDPRGWSTSGEWTEEAREEALARAPGFGRRFFTELVVHFPQASGAAVFLRWSVQPGDVYAVVDLPDGGFAVQVDQIPRVPHRLDRRRARRVRRLGR